MSPAVRELPEEASVGGLIRSNSSRITSNVRFDTWSPIAFRATTFSLAPACDVNTRSIASIAVSINFSMRPGGSEGLAILLLPIMVDVFFFEFICHFDDISVSVDFFDPG